MYIYDTRYDIYETLPLNGWLFPCFICNNITSNFITTKHCYNYKCITITIPLCKSCNIDNMILNNKYIKKV